MKIAKRIPAYPFLLAIAPAISFYAQNITQTNIADIWRLVFALLLFAAISFFILNRFLRHIQKTALIIAYGVLLFYLIVPVQMFLITKMGLGRSSIRLRYIAPIFLLVFLIGAWNFLRRNYSTDSITKIATVFALSIYILPLATFGSHAISVNRVANILISNQLSENSINEGSFTYSGEDQPPDVYLILLDAHSSISCLEENFGYDDDGFVNALKNMGFFVAHQSLSNYPAETIQAMSAYLNMVYHDHEFISQLSPGDVINYFRDQLHSNLVVSIFQSLGYDFVNFKTRYPSINIPNPQYFFDFFYYPGTSIHLPNRFETVFASKIPINILSIKDYFNEDFIHYRSIKQLLDFLPSLPDRSTSPIFAYIHLMIPHEPYVFSSDGEFVTGSDYFSQVAFIDGEIIHVLEKLIMNSRRPPIIILQGDHGSEEICVVPILNAYYFPDVNPEEILYQNISPINSFRTILNTYFQADLPLLEDKVFFGNLNSNKSHRESGIGFEFIRCIYDTGSSNCR